MNPLYNSNCYISHQPATAMEVAELVMLNYYLSFCHPLHGLQSIAVTSNSKHPSSAPLTRQPSSRGWIKIPGTHYPARADIVSSLLLLFVFKIDLVCAIPKVCSLATLVHGLARRKEGSSANPMRLCVKDTHTHAQLQSVIFNICTRPKFLCRIVYRYSKENYCSVSWCIDLKLSINQSINQTSAHPIYDHRRQVAVARIESIKHQTSNKCFINMTTDIVLIHRMRVLYISHTI